MGANDAPIGHQLELVVAAVILAETGDAVGLVEQLGLDLLRAEGVDLEPQVLPVPVMEGIVDLITQLDTERPIRVATAYAWSRSCGGRLGIAT